MYCSTLPLRGNRRILQVAAVVWALDRSVTTNETDTRRRSRLDNQIIKYGKEWSLSETPDAGKGKAAAGDRCSARTVGTRRDGTPNHEA